ncbi:MAG TPA: SdrD B-like domain-containing protein, partial [Actinotalea sp.]|nr:SdrD B-like domain-containing protein [Actinotalea sp.]
MRLRLPGYPAAYTVGAVDEVVRFTYQATVRNASGPVASANVTNTARLTATGMTAIQRQTTTRVVEPNIRVAKAELDVDNLATPGEDIAFRLTVTNPGPNSAAPWTSTAYDSQIVDDIPTSMTPLGAGGVPLAGDGVVVPDGGLWDESERTITWNRSTTPELLAIAPSATVVLDYGVQVADPVPSPTTFTNDVEITTTSMSGVVPGERGFTTATALSAARYRSTSSVTLNGPQPALVSKTVSPSRVVPGEVVTFTLRGSVPPSVTTNDATVLDTLPAGLTFIETVSSACQSAGPCDLAATELTASDQRIGWYLGDVPASPDERIVEIVYTAYVDGTVPTVAQGETLTNEALVRFSATPGPAPTTPVEADALPGASAVVAATVTVDEPLVTLTKTVADGPDQVEARRVVPGETLAYAISLTNAGPVTARDVVVDDVTDARFGAVTDVTGATLVDGTAPTLRFTIDEIPAGAAVTVRYVVVVPDLTSADEVAGPELTNTAAASYTSVAGLPPGARTYTTDDDTVELEVDLASLGDTVWFDTDGDGNRGLAEPGVPGIEVTVIYLGPDDTFGTADDEPHAVTTDADGRYLVPTLPQGQYRAVVTTATLPAGTAVTSDLDGTAGGLGTVGTALTGGQDRTDVDFGLRGTGVVGDLVWLDLDGDGAPALDGSEPGLGGIGVDVSWPGLDGIAGTADDVLVRVVTAADGSWTVPGIPATTVTVTLDAATFPAGLTVVSERHGGTADGTATFPLDAGETDREYDFGLAGPGEIGDRLWVDTNGDGVQDDVAVEPGIPGATGEVRWHGLDGVA